MKIPFTISLISAFIGSIGLVALSAMTIVPGSGAETFRERMMLVVGVSILVWLGMAVWVRPRRRSKQQTLPPRWLGRLLIIAGAVYISFVAVFVIG